MSATVTKHGGDQQAKLTVINALLKERRLTVIQMPSGDYLYKFISEEYAIKTKDLDEQEISTYQLIEGSGNKGI